MSKFQDFADFNEGRKTMKDFQRSSSYDYVTGHKDEVLRNATTLNATQKKFLDKVIEESLCKVAIHDGMVDVTGNVSLEWWKGSVLPVKFGQVTGHFSMSDNQNLISLKGTPYSCRGFYIRNFQKLKSLLFSPKVIHGDFDMKDCNGIKSLVGGPREVKEIYNCSFCESLESLEGAPHRVGDLLLKACKALKSLEHAPETINGSLDCSYCHSLTSIDGMPKFMEGIMDFKSCVNIPENQLVVAYDKTLRKMWLDSGMPILEFLEKRRGSIKGRKFGL